MKNFDELLGRECSIFVIRRVFFFSLITWKQEKIKQKAVLNSNELLKSIKNGIHFILKFFVSYLKNATKLSFTFLLIVRIPSNIREEESHCFNRYIHR